MLDLPVKVVFVNNTHRLGDLGAPASLRVIAAHTQADHIRYNVVAARAHEPDDFLDDSNLQNFGEDLRQLVEYAAVGVNALDAFLGEPASYPDPGSVLDQVKATNAAPGPGSKVSAK